LTDAGNYEACGQLRQRQGAASGYSTLNVPEDDAPVFGAPAGMFPRFGGQRGVDGRAALRCRQPRVDDEAGAGVQLVSLRRQVDVVDGIQERRRRDLGRLRTPGSRAGAL